MKNNLIWPFSDNKEGILSLFYSALALVAFRVNSIRKAAFSARPSMCAIRFNAPRGVCSMVFDPKSTDPFFAAFGRAMARWQDIETGLYILIHALLGTEPRVTSILFFHINSAKTKLSLCDRLCAEKLKESMKKDWRSLSKQVTEALESRNKLAHFEMSWIIPGAEIPDLPHDDPPMLFGPHHLDFFTWEKKNGVAFSKKDFEDFSDIWKKLVIDLFEFTLLNFPLETLYPTKLPPSLAYSLANIEVSLHARTRLHPPSPPTSTPP
jgi:hypothetical protein